MPWLEDKLKTPNQGESKKLLFWIAAVVVLGIVIYVGRKAAGDPPANTAQAASTTKNLLTAPAPKPPGSDQTPAQQAASSLSRDFRNAAPVDAFGNPVVPGSVPGTASTVPNTGLPPVQQQAVMPAYGGQVEGGQAQDESPVAWSYRPGATLAQATPPGMPGSPPPSDAELARELIAAAASGSPVAQTVAQTPNPMPQPPKPEDEDVVIIGSGTKVVGKGSRYVLPEGTWFQCTLQNRLSGDFTGPVICGVAVDVWDHSTKHILLPAGSANRPGEQARVIGEAYQVGNQDQRRLAIAFHQISYWKGETRVKIGLDKFKGLDQAGATGVRDLVNNHWLQTFGVAAAIGVLGGLTYANTGSALTAGGIDAYRQGMAQEIGMEGQQILSRFLNRLPEITIREGQVINVYIGTDLWIPAVDELTGVQQ